MIQDLLRTADLNPDEFKHIIDLAIDFKKNPYKHHDLLNNDSVVLYFNKPSTRTRISCETAITRLGGLPISVGSQELQLGRGETIEDTAEVISRYARAFIIRTFNHDDIERFAKTASIPVINALTDDHHPLQSLADIMTIQEKFGRTEDIKIAYVGDYNNVSRSLEEAAKLAGATISIASPNHDDISVAVRNADVVYTDVWMSMGTPESERAEKMALLKPYQVNDALMKLANPNAIFMHCLPAHRGEEVTASVIDGPQSVVFDQAENRLHTAVAVLFTLC